MDKNKKVLIFSLAYFPQVGGAEIAIKEITDRINDIEFDLIAKRFEKDSKSSEKIGNVYVHRINSSKLLFPINSFLFAKKLHKKNNYDGIWGMMAAQAGAGAMFFKWNNKKIPFILSLQEGIPLEYINKIMKPIMPLYKKIFLLADRIQVISTFLVGFAKSYGYKGRVVVIPNGVNYKNFSAVPSPAKMAKLEELLKKKEDEIYLITTSRLDEKNAVDDSIKSLKYLPNNIKLLVVGTGPDEAKLKFLTTTLGLENRVIFTGFVKHEDIPLYLHASDVFVRPSLSEGMGNSFIEAMAAGLPVIATPVGGIIDFLFDPDKNPEIMPTGLFCEVKNPESLAKQAERLLADKKLKEEILENSKLLVTKKYDWNLIAKQMRTKVFDCI